MGFLELHSKDYSLVYGMLFFIWGMFVFGVGIFDLYCSDLENFLLFFYLIIFSCLWFFILFFNVLTRVFTVVIFACVGLCTAFVCAWSFLVMFSMGVFVLFCFIIVKVEEYFCRLSCTSFCHIMGVYGTSFGLLVFGLFEKTIFVTAIFFKCWIFCFMFSY